MLPQVRVKVKRSGVFAFALGRRLTPPDGEKTKKKKMSHPDVLVQTDRRMCARREFLTFSLLESLRRERRRITLGPLKRTDQSTPSPTELDRDHGGRQHVEQEQDPRECVRNGRRPAAANAT